MRLMMTLHGTRDVVEIAENIKDHDEAVKLLTQARRFYFTGRSSRISYRDMLIVGPDATIELVR